MVDLYFKRGYTVKELNKRSKKKITKPSKCKTKSFTKKKYKDNCKSSYNMRDRFDQYYVDTEEFIETKNEIKIEDDGVIRRGDIIYCSLENIGEGSEQAGKRPAIVVQNDTGNKFSSTTIVVFLTSKNKTKLPTHVDLICGQDYKLLQKSGYSKNIALCEQVRTISKSRIIHKLGTVRPTTMTKIDKALLISQGIDLTNLEKYKY